MAWKNIIGQERVKKILQRGVLENRIPHAYFIWGMEGVGKDAIAIEFAKTANCRRPVVNGDAIEACGECHSCIKADKFQHPNIQFVCSLPAGKGTDARNDSPFSKLSDEQVEEVLAELKLKSENPYYKINIANANQIRVSSIRYVKRSLTLGASEEGRRCVIISNADEMNAESANAFLKTLEEPHDNISILITSSRQEQILPTILSRCQQIFCEPLPEEDIAYALETRLNVGAAEARLAAAFSQGSYTRAVDFLDEEMKDFRESVVSAFRTALRKKTYRSELLSGLGDLFKQKDKNRVEKYLSLLLIWLRDAHLIAAGGDKSRILNVDQADMLERFAANFRDSDFDKAVGIVERAVGRIRRNVQIQLILLSMFVELRGIFLGKTI